MYTEIGGCRYCGSKEFDAVINLGLLYPSAFDDTNLQEPAPLELVSCKKCGLVQLKHTADLNKMYRDMYWYRSALNPSMVKALEDVAEKAIGIVQLKPGDAVLDIGSNDGTLLSMFPNFVTKYGVDPADNVYDSDSNLMDVFINDFFTKDTRLDRKFKIITSIAMFYDLPDPGGFIEAVKECLDEDGVWIIQFTDLLSMFKLNAYDNLCHEHLEYYDLVWIKYVMSQHGLRVFKVEHNEVNGGSIRVYVDFNKRPIHDSVYKYISDETDFFAGYNDAFQDFRDHIEYSKKTILNYIKDKKVFLLGASTKGNTLLQYCGITNKDIPYAAEVNADKFGKRTVATNIEIIPEYKAIEMKPDCFLILPWHFKKVFERTMRSYLEAGGELLVPLPVPAIGYLTEEGIIWETI